MLADIATANARVKRPPTPRSVATNPANREPSATDPGLVNLTGLTKLQDLNLYATTITDAGLAHLKGLTNLQTLSLPTKTTDAGLVHLNGLTGLKTLDVRFNKITDEGVEKLQQALPNCEIRSEPQIR